MLSKISTRFKSNVFDGFAIGLFGGLLGSFIMRLLITLFEWGT